jgi:hypothetical protein
MRTTLDIDADVLDQARQIAALRKQSLGKVISDVFRKNSGPEYTTVIKNGLRVIHRGDGAKVVTMEMVNKLRDEE